MIVKTFDHIKRWVDEPLQQDAPVVAVLRRHPGRFAVIDEALLEYGGEYVANNQAVFDCQAHPRVELRHHREPLDGGVLHEVRARWIPQEEWAARNRSDAFNQLVRAIREALQT